MVRVFESENYKISVFLKDGQTFLNKDIPTKPFGDTERIVAFWNEDKILMIPMDQVDFIEFFEDK